MAGRPFDELDRKALVRDIWSVSARQSVLTSDEVQQAVSSHARRAVRATSEALAPGSNEAATSRSYPHVTIAGAAPPT